MTSPGNEREVVKSLRGIDRNLERIADALEGLLQIENHREKEKKERVRRFDITNVPAVPISATEVGRTCDDSVVDAHN